MKMFWDLPMGNVTDAEMLDKMRVRELVETDRYCRDYHHFEKERECWFDDGKVYATWFKGSIDDFIQKSGRPDKTPSHHKINNTMVWLKGNRAIAECICTLQFRIELVPGEPLDLVCWSRLHFRAEKREGKWGLVYFEGIYEKDRLDPIFSDSEWVVPREELQKYRPINWNMMYRLTKFSADPFGGGVENADNWAGKDKPETILRLYEESSKWIGLE